MTVYIAGCHTDYCVAVEGVGGKIKYLSGENQLLGALVTKRE